MKTGAELIRIERLRQITKKGYDAAHDDRQDRRQLAKAAESYLSTHAQPDVECPRSPQRNRSNWNWPWSDRRWKPSKDPVRNLTIAGALIAAEIDRLQRIKK